MVDGVVQIFCVLIGIFNLVLSISYLEKDWSPTMFEYLSISSFTFSVFASGILKFCYEAHIFIIFIAFWYINFLIIIVYSNLFYVLLA